MPVVSKERTEDDVDYTTVYCSYVYVIPELHMRSCHVLGADLATKSRCESL